MTSRNGIAIFGGFRVAALWYAGNAAALAAILLVPAWIKAALHQHHNYDLGIFAQAFNSISPNNLNPFIPALNLRLFNDHFDPILIPASLAARIVEPAYAVLTVEHVLALLTPLPLIILSLRRPGGTPFTLFSTTYLLLNRGMTSALGFPAHPTAWAAFFIVAMGCAAVGRRRTALILAAALMMACKEEFPFAALAIGAWLAWRGDRTAGWSLVGLASIWLAVAFWLRPLFLGEVSDHASRVLIPFFRDPAGLVRERLSNPREMKTLFQAVAPLAPAIWALYRRKTAPDLMMLAAAAPLIAIRFLSGAWGFHYTAPVSAFLLLAVWSRGANVMSARAAALGIAIVALSNGGPIGRGASVYLSSGDLRGERREAIESARSLLIENDHGSVLAGGNLVPLLARRSNVFQIGGVQPEQEYRFVFTEKPPMGNPWPASHSDVEQLIAEWRRDSIVLLDNEHVFLAERSNRQQAGHQSGNPVLSSIVNCGRWIQGGGATDPLHHAAEGVNSIRLPPERRVLKLESLRAEP